MDLAQFWFQAAGGAPPAAIGNSLRFRGTQYLAWTPAADGNRKTWTWSGWVKRGPVDTPEENIFGVEWPTGRVPSNKIGFGGSADSSQIPTFSIYLGSGSSFVAQSPGVARDPAAWMHFVAVWDTTNATESERMRFYINGVQQPRVYGNGIAQDFDGGSFNTATLHRFSGGPADGRLFQGYLAETHFIDGTALDATSFGEFNADGVWVPKKVSGVTYGTNGFYLDFSDAADIGADRSGNGNNWTATGFELTDTSSTNYDWVADSPTDNFSTLNPLVTTQGTYSEANLAFTNSSWRRTQGTNILKSGKWYVEATLSSDPHSSTISGRFNEIGFGPNKFDADTSASNLYDGDCFAIDTNGFYTNGTGSTNIYTDSGIRAVAGDVIALAADLDANTISVFHNGTKNVDSLAFNFSYQDGVVFLFMSAGSYGLPKINFGNRPFQYTPPVGFEPLSTAELPAVSITNPSDHFQTLLSDDAKTPEPAAIGAAYGGGFYAGRIKDGSKVYNLIVAPLESGGLQGQLGGATPTPTQWKTSASGPDTTAQSVSYGGTAMLANSTATHPTFNWCVSSPSGPNAGNYDATNAAGTGIGGFNDWYIPARNELEILYRHLKPDTTANDTSWGANPNAVPPTSNYTSGSPAQTAVAAFQSGGAQAFAATTTLYWSASENSGLDYGAWAQGFNNGFQDDDGGSKTNGWFARAIRREFAYDAGLLDYAQATFPNGLWWIKDRANSNQHQLVDSVRGGNLAFQLPNNVDQQAYVAPSGNSVAWCWALGSSTVTNTDGSIQSQVNANKAAGFSSVSWTGTKTLDTVGHGLDRAPEFMIFRPSNGTISQTHVHHSSVGPSYVGFLNSSAAFYGPYPDWMNNTSPTDSVFTVNTDNDINGAGQPIYAYCWHSVPGYSSFGSYSGTSGTDGSFIYTGFRIGWLMIKRTNTSSSSWYIFDNQRNTYNPVQHYLRSNLEDPEDASQNLPIDFLSNGFKCRTGSGYIDDAGDSYMYIAFAEHCFGGSNVSPAPAR